MRNILLLAAGCGIRGLSETLGRRKRERLEEGQRLVLRVFPYFYDFPLNFFLLAGRLLGRHSTTQIVGSVDR